MRLCVYEDQRENDLERGDQYRSIAACSSFLSLGLTCIFCGLRWFHVSLITADSETKVFFLASFIVGIHDVMDSMFRISALSADRLDGKTDVASECDLHRIRADLR